MSAKWKVQVSIEGPADDADKLAKVKAAIDQLQPDSVRLFLTDHKDNDDEPLGFA
ncbi:MAG: hypothetical protein OXG44_10700 [Gammaproteobacteria bacterium]|nr:hypothetical protein [Gammaproteobacteria bacterium]